MTDDVRSQLTILSVFHWVLAGFTLLFTLFPLLYVAMGVFFLRGDDFGGPHQTPPPPFLGWMMIAIGLAMAAGFVGYAVLVAVAGRFIARTRHWMFVVVVNALSCAFFPFGTVLGVFTIIVLSRPAVRAAFESPAGPTGITA